MILAETPGVAHEIGTNSIFLAYVNPEVPIGFLKKSGNGFFCHNKMSTYSCWQDIPLSISSSVLS